jgi:hypothetical protein
MTAVARPQPSQIPWARSAKLWGIDWRAFYHAAMAHFDIIGPGLAQTLSLIAFVSLTRSDALAPPTITAWQQMHRH